MNNIKMEDNRERRWEISDKSGRRRTGDEAWVKGYRGENLIQQGKKEDKGNRRK